MNLPVFIANIPKKSIGSRSRAGGPMELIDMLFAPNGKYAPKQVPSNQIDRQVERNITRLLEYDNDGNSRER